MARLAYGERGAVVNGRTVPVINSADINFVDENGSDVDHDDACKYIENAFNGACIHSAMGRSDLIDRGQCVRCGALGWKCRA